MTTAGLFLAHGLLAASLAVGVQADPPQDDRLYGRVVTTSGDVFEGFIRWDRNEGTWSDLLHGSKRLSEAHMEEADRLAGRDYREERRESIEILGLTISWDDDETGWPSSAQSGIRFGHLRSLEVLSGNRALLVLKSGEEVEMEGYSTDVGSGLRELVVEDPQRGTVELDWDDLELVDFMQAPEEARARSGARLWGTVRTRWDQAFTGYVTWDLDEIYGQDVLDGEDGGRDREIPFSNIVSIERRGSGAAGVVLANGEEMTLDDSNDVDSSNRGILVVDPELGEVTIQWEEFEDVVFNPAPSPARYDEFDGGGRLYGTVETEDGRALTGYIRWDNDEEYAWELLDGEYRDVEFDIEFRNIETIEKEWSRGSVVTLRDGRSFELEGSNDVDRGNKGIFVIDGDDVQMIEWRDFRRVTFRAP